MSHQHIFPSSSIHKFACFVQILELANILKRQLAGRRKHYWIRGRRENVLEKIKEMKGGGTHIKILVSEYGRSFLEQHHIAPLSKNISRMVHLILPKGL